MATVKHVRELNDDVRPMVSLSSQGQATATGGGGVFPKLRIRRRSFTQDYFSPYWAVIVLGPIELVWRRFANEE